MTRNCGKKIGHDLVFPPAKKGVIPRINDMPLGEGLYFRKVHNHPVIRSTSMVDYLAFDCYFKHIAVTMQVFALTPMIGDTMPCVEFEATGDQHK